MATIPTQDRLIVALQSDDHESLIYRPAYLAQEDPIFRRRLVAALRRCTTLQDITLDLKEAPETLDEVGLVVFGENPLKNVSLVSSQLTPPIIQHWYWKMSVNRVLTEVSFRYSRFTQNSLCLLLEALTPTKIRLLDLYHTAVGECEGNLTHLGDFLEKNESVKELVLEYCNINYNRGFKGFCKAFAKNKTLTTLSLLNNAGISDDGALELCTYLKQNYTLGSLNLSYCNITNTGGIHVAQLLSVNKELRYLYLNFNAIGDAAFAQIAKSLEHNKSLLEIFCIRNPMTTNIVNQLSTLVQLNSTLLTIDLSDSFHLKQGIESDYLLSSLKSNNCITCLDLNGEKPVLDGIEEVSRINFKLKRDIFKEIVTKKNTQTTWNKMKLFLVGRARCGKSSTVRSLLGDSFKPNIESTLGSTIQTAVAKFTHDPQRKWEKSTIPLYSKFHASLAVSTALYTPKKTPNQKKILKHYESKKIEVKSKSSRYKVSKLPAPVRRHPSGKASTMERKFDPTLLVENTSKNSDMEFTIHDYGGQNVFHPFHQTFMTDGGIVLVVFSLLEFQKVANQVKPTFPWVRPRTVLFDKIQEMDCVQDLVFWLRNVAFFSPSSQILLIGTFADKVKKNMLQRINDVIALICFEMKINISPREPVANNGLKYFYYPVSNSTGSGFTAVKQAVKKLTYETLQPNETVPLKYMFCLDELLELGNHLPLQKFKAVAQRFSVQGEDINYMLKIFSERGAIFFKDASEIMSETIVVKPVWLLKSISTLIRDPEFHFDTYFHSLDFEKIGLLEAFMDWKNKGIISFDLIEYLFKNSQVETSFSEKEVEFIVEFMKSVMLIATFSRKKNLYLIPSMIPNTNAIPESLQVCCGCFFRIQDEFEFLNFSVFQRLCCLMLEFINAHDSECEIEVTSSYMYAVIKGNEFWLCEGKGNVQFFASEDADAYETNKIYDSVKRSLGRIERELLGGRVKYESFFWEDTDTLHALLEMDYIPETVASENGQSPWFSNFDNHDTLRMDLAGFLDD